MSSPSIDFLSTLRSNQLETQFAAVEEPRRPRHNRQSQTKDIQPTHTLTLLNPPSTPPPPPLPPPPPPPSLPVSSSSLSKDVEVTTSHTNTASQQSKRRKQLMMPFLPYHPHRNNVDYLTTNLENVKPMGKKSQTNLFLIIAILFMLGGWSIFLYYVIKHRHQHSNDLDL